MSSITHWKTWKQDHLHCVHKWRQHSQVTSKSAQQLLHKQDYLPAESDVAKGHTQLVCTFCRMQQSVGNLRVLSHPVCLLGSEAFDEFVTSNHFKWKYLSKSTKRKILSVYSSDISNGRTEKQIQEDQCLYTDATGLRCSSLRTPVGGLGLRERTHRPPVSSFLLSWTWGQHSNILITLHHPNSSPQSNIVSLLQQDDLDN